MEMNKNIYIIIILLFSICAGLQAQITVGSDNKPEKFSALQLDGETGGLRLPQLSVLQRNSLPVVAADAGLMIYNQTNNKIEYWDGTTWLTVGDTINIYNGITRDGVNTKFGGKLTENTNININNNKLNFIGTGSYSVGDTLLVVGNNIVSVKPSKFTVNKDYLNISDGKTEIALDTLKSGVFITNGNSLLSVGRDDNRHRNVAVSSNLQYKDGNQADGKPLLSKASGDAYWGLLKPDAVIKTGTILPGGTLIFDYGGGTITADPIVSNSLSLEAGKWLIMAKFTTTTSYTAQKMFSWGSLWTTDGSSNTQVAAIGADVDDKGLGFVQIVYLLDTTVDTNVFIRCGSSNQWTYLTDNYAASNFTAILIDKPLD